MFHDKDEKVGLLCSNLPNGMRSLIQEEELSFNGGSWIVIGGVLFFVGLVEWLQLALIMDIIET